MCLQLDRGTPPCCDVMLSVHFVTMTLMSELPAGDTHDVIRHSGQVVAVVVPIEEYQQLRQAMQEQQVNEEFDAARARYLARREAGAIRYVSHEEAGRRLGMPSRRAIRSTGRFKLWTRRRASSATIPSVSLRSGTMLVSSPMSRGRRSRSLTGRRICGACGPGGTASSTRSTKNGGQSRSTTSPACRSPGISSPCRR